jgi:hypothetical protein
MDFALTQAREDAAAILASAPSVLAKAAAFVTGDGPEPQIDWAKIAYLASQNVLSSGDRAFLGICAEIAGFNPDLRPPPTRPSAPAGIPLTASTSRSFASVLTQSSQTKQSREREILEQLGVPSAYPSVPRPQLVRVRLGPDHPAVTNDALGRGAGGLSRGRLAARDVAARGAASGACRPTASSPRSG